MIVQTSLAISYNLICHYAGVTHKSMPVLVEVV